MMSEETLTTWKETADSLRQQGWTVEHVPLLGLPAWVWRSPSGVSGSDYRSNHPDGPPLAVMQDAYRHGQVNFLFLENQG